MSRAWRCMWTNDGSENVTLRFPTRPTRPSDALRLFDFVIHPFQRQVMVELHAKTDEKRVFARVSSTIEATTSLPLETLRLEKERMDAAITEEIRTQSSLHGASSQRLH